VCLDRKWKFSWPRICDFYIKEFFYHEIIPVQNFQLSATLLILAINNSILCMEVFSKYKRKIAPVLRISLYCYSKSK